MGVERKDGDRSVRQLWLESPLALVSSARPSKRTRS